MNINILTNEQSNKPYYIAGSQLSMTIIFYFQQILCNNEGQIHVPSQVCHVYTATMNSSRAFLSPILETENFNCPSKWLNEPPKCLTSLIPSGPYGIMYIAKFRTL
ncbi:uncharacterized protein J3R85_011008 [Psidium guajava]|nr:uncharacterized protein J3R85_011008 [Psidium guajava]